MILNSTVQNPVLIAGEKFNCFIEGSGFVEHFGNQGWKYPSVQVKLFCDEHVKNWTEVA